MDIDWDGLLCCWWDGGLASVCCWKGRDSLHRRVELERDTRARRPIYFIDTWRSLRGCGGGGGGLVSLSQDGSSVPRPPGTGDPEAFSGCAAGLRAAPKPVSWRGREECPLRQPPLPGSSSQTGGRPACGVLHVGHREVSLLVTPLPGLSSSITKTRLTENVVATKHAPHFSVHSAIRKAFLKKKRVFVIINYQLRGRAPPCLPHYSHVPRASICRRLVGVFRRPCFLDSAKRSGFRKAKDPRSEKSRFPPFDDSNIP